MKTTENIAYQQLFELIEKHIHEFEQEFNNMLKAQALKRISLDKIMHNYNSKSWAQYN